jgi:multidrug efflux system membrane fusion protein
MYQSFDRPVAEAETRIPAALEQPEAPRPRHRKTLAGVAVFAIAVAGIGLKGFGGSEVKADASVPPNVTVSRPLQRAITEWDDYTGRFDASQSVEIRPRVSGQLVGIHFKDGDLVQKGQLLFTIDQRPYVAALAEAQARAATAQTQLVLARSEYARAARLVSDEAVSQEEVDSLRASMKSGEASVAAAQALVRQRQLDREFTEVRAPITGRISNRRVDIGNLVSANDSMLTTVLALDPIYFTFDASEALYLKNLREQRRDGATPQRVQIKLQDEPGYEWQGNVDFTDNAIDPRSGTIRGRAVIRNPDYFLAPGMFGNMRQTGGSAQQALLVPDTAVRTDQARKIVLVVGKDDLVAARQVEPGPLIGGLRSIRSGLKPDDRVVIQGVQFATPGSKVSPRPGRIDPPPVAASQTPIDIQAASQATLAAR